MADIPYFTLNNGTKIPSVGMGCWLGPDGGLDTIEKMVTDAIKNGYRHLDTAVGYSNEELVGKAIRESGIPRNEIYLTTKLPSKHHHCVRESFEESLKKLNCEYIDLYLMHWPFAEVDGRSLSPEVHPTFVDTWKEMEKLLDTGKVKSIGVSNFSIKTLTELLAHAKVVPATNQVEINPCLPQFELQKFCEEKGILITAYSPFGQSNPLFFDDPDLKQIAERRGVTVPQLTISWIVQRGIITIPKSQNPERMKTNITLLKLTPEEMQAFDELHKKPGMHRSLLPYHNPDNTVLGWTYEQLGWPMTTGGFAL